MKPNETKKEYRMRRFFEILPGFLSWATVIGIFPLSYYAPVAVAIFVILYDLSWLIKIMHISTHLIYSYNEVRKTNATDYVAKLKELEGKHDLSWRDVYHVVVIPTVNEPMEVLDASIQAIVNAKYPLDRVMLVMAFEERSGDAGREKSALIHEKYGSTFAMLKSYFHPSDIPGEIKAKSSNMTFAMRRFREEIDAAHIPYEHVIVSAFDSDTQISKQYLGELTHKYITNPRRTHSSYQPIPVYHNNLWDVPSMARVSALGSTFWQMIEASRPQRLITFSSHAMSMKALVEVDFWPVDVISEDSQIFWRSYLHYNGDYYVEPMFSTVSMDATAGETYWKAHRAQYIQKQRWFWGVENFPYISLGFIEHKRIALSSRIAQWFRMLDSFYTLATAPIILAVGGWLPTVLGGDDFAKSVVSQNLVVLTQVLTTLALVGLLTTFIISMSIIPNRPKNTVPHRRISMLTQWLLVPIVTFVFGSVPALDSQTRLMTGNYIGEFWVAEKTRKKGSDKAKTPA